mmetsp:Transcript_68854/g.149862  ORF Transcript_68854/g.149862 Transcript_68854/m.149862 type:complete len:325 (+) Transcript_68854:48-1022(+)
MASPLQVSFPSNSLYNKLTLVNPRDPSSWTVSSVHGREHSLKLPMHSGNFLGDVEKSCQTDVRMIYISIAQDEDGQHRFISLSEAGSFFVDGTTGLLTVLSEVEVKARGEEEAILLLYAKAPANGRASGRFEPQGVDELCPRASVWARNYSVIPDLSLGLTQRLILCDEATLTRSLPGEKIFDHLTLIVNCHERTASPGKYKVGICGTEKKPAIICQAVHNWHSLDNAGMNATNDQMQTAIWEHLQSGTVAVHCLAGIHRAACIVACHFLWRYYILGHKDIPHDSEVIYSRLKAVRPAVSPAYLHVLRSYEAHLKRSAPRSAET